MVAENKKTDINTLEVWVAAEFDYHGTNGEYKTIEHHDFWLVWEESRKGKPNSRISTLNSEHKSSQEIGMVTLQKVQGRAQ